MIQNLLENNLRKMECVWGLWGFGKKVKSAENTGLQAIIPQLGAIHDSSPNYNDGWLIIYPNK
jgi:hypothetical protein